MSRLAYPPVERGLIALEDQGCVLRISDREAPRWRVTVYGPDGRPLAEASGISRSATVAAATEKAWDALTTARPQNASPRVHVPGHSGAEWCPECVAEEDGLP